MICNEYRHPVLLAKAIATLDLLSGGRFELGLGAGFSRPEYDQAGLMFGPPGVRVNRFAEALQIRKGLFGAEPFAFSGSFYTVTDLDSFPKPVQQPHPPILVGAGVKSRYLFFAEAICRALGNTVPHYLTGRNGFAAGTIKHLRAVLPSRLPGRIGLDL